MNALTNILRQAARNFNAMRVRIAAASGQRHKPAPLIKVAEFGDEVCGAGVYATRQGAEHLVMYVLNGEHLVNSNGFVPGKAEGVQLAEGFARKPHKASAPEGWDKIETDAQAEQDALETRACTNEGCGWEDKTDRVCGSVGPLCERCDGTTEVIDSVNGPSETCDEGTEYITHQDADIEGGLQVLSGEGISSACAVGEHEDDDWTDDGTTSDDSPNAEPPQWHTAQQQKIASMELETAVPNDTPSTLKLRPYQQAAVDAIKARVAKGDKLVLDIPVTTSRTVGTASMNIVPAPSVKVKIEHGRETKRRKARRAGNKKSRGMNAQTSNLLSKLLGH